MVKQIFVGMMDSSSTEQAENEADLLKVNPGVYIIARVVKNGNVDCNTQLHYLSNSTFPLFSRALSLCHFPAVETQRMLLSTEATQD